MDKILQNNGYKLTKPRLAIIKLFDQHIRPLSCRDIFLKLNKKYDLASIYRTLTLLKALDIVQEDRINKESYYFFSRKHHHHITCRKCGKIADVTCRNINIRVSNFKNIQHQLSITGICNNCL